MRKIIVFLFVFALLLISYKEKEIVVKTENDEHNKYK